jgi:hypothetical protein
LLRRKLVESSLQDRQLLINSASANDQLLSTASGLSADLALSDADKNVFELIDLKAEVHRLTDLVNSLSIPSLTLFCLIYN